MKQSSHPEKNRTHRRMRNDGKVPEAQTGNPPGSFAGDRNFGRTEIFSICYGPDELIEKKISPDQIPELLGQHQVVWLDIVGVGDTETIHQLGKIFALHSLALDDVQSVGQRTKVEIYGNHLFIIMHFTIYNGTLTTGQIGLFLGQGFVLTFRDQGGDCFSPVRLMLRENRPRLRSSMADYLVYILLDSVIDHYFLVLDQFADRLERIEELILGEHDGITLLFTLRREMQTLRKQMIPLREMLGNLLQVDLPVIEEKTCLYLRDCNNHLNHLVDDIEHMRENASNLMDVHFALSGQQLNNITKVLMIIATIFIPLSFIAGLYGMNFDPKASVFNMPELGWPFGYPLILGIMAIVVIIQLFYFKRKGWIGSRQKVNPNE